MSNKSGAVVEYNAIQGFEKRGVVALVCVGNMVQQVKNLDKKVYIRALCYYFRIAIKNIQVSFIAKLEQIKRPSLVKIIYSPCLSLMHTRRVFSFICLLKYLLLRANPQNNLKTKLDALFAKYPEVPIKYLGIPSDDNGDMMDWENQPIWN
jgi:abortive infection bacteriophage resistance protein